jgi:uncharacterized protein (DUF1501 family)
MDENACGCGHQGHSGMNRRSFLKRAASTGALAGLATQGLATKYAFAQGAYDGDILVVISLRGGMDGVNAFVPASGSDWQRYNALRPNVGVPHSQLIPLDSQFGMHPALQPLEKYWNRGTFGIVHAVGMETPTRSHFQAMAEMERAAPGTPLRSGWLDRTLGLRSAGTAYRGMQVGMNMPSVALKGPAPELAVLSVDSFTLAQVDSRADRARWREALAGMNADAPSVMAAPARTALSAIGAAAEMQRDGYRARSGVSYPKSEVGTALKDVARMIKAKVGLQVAAVDYGEWDMHAGMGGVGSGWLREHLSQLARSLDAFATDLGSTMDRVTVITLSEFGRRIKENGSGGTDHGHGQAVMMLGGGVRGGQFHGTWPGLAEVDLVDGDLAGTTDYRTILAEALEKRCGAGSLSTVFPGLGSDRLNAFKARA